MTADIDEVMNSDLTPSQKQKMLIQMQQHQHRRMQDKYSKHYEMLNGQIKDKETNFNHSDEVQQISEQIQKNKGRKLETVHEGKENDNADVEEGKFRDEDSYYEEATHYIYHGESGRYRDKPETDDEEDEENKDEEEEEGDSENEEDDELYQGRRHDEDEDENRNGGDHDSYNSSRDSRGSSEQLSGQSSVDKQGYKGNSPYQEKHMQANNSPNGSQHRQEKGAKNDLNEGPSATFKGFVSATKDIMIGLNQQISQPLKKALQVEHEQDDEPFPGFNAYLAEELQ